MKKNGKTIGLAVLIIFATVFTVYIPALDNDFVNWDDNVYLYENPHIRSLNISSIYRMFTEFHAGLWLPLAWMSHALDYAMWGFDPFGHHLTSIILHALNTILLFLLFIQLVVTVQKPGQTQPAFQIPRSLLSPILVGAGVAALLFGVHPLRVESVVWACERKDVLCGFFYLLCLICYVSYVSAPRKEKRWRYVVVLSMFILALLSKPMAVALPVILLLLDFYPLNRITLATTKNLWVLWEKIPFLILSLITGIITTLAQSEEATTSLEYLPLIARLLNALRTVVFYLQKIIIPTNLVPFYPYPLKIYAYDAKYIIAGIVVLLISSGCYWMVKKKKHLFFAVWTYYVVTLLPVIGIVQVGKQAAADRFTYLPSVSIFFLAGIGVLWVIKNILLTKQKALFGGLFLTLICTVLIALSYATTKQISIWQNSEILWRCVIDHFPEEIPLAYNNLGHAYYEQGKTNKAIEEYHKALAIQPDNKLARFNLGYAYAKLGKIDQAIAEYEHLLTTTPLYFDAYYNLGLAYYEKGRLDKVVEAYHKALAINPQHALTHNNLGVVYEKLGEINKAISEYEQAIEINPTIVEAHNNLGTLYESQGMLDKASIQYEKLLFINPDSSDVHNKLGNVYAERGMSDKAIAEFKRSLEINPNNLEAQNNLAAINMKKGMADEAITDYQRAITLNPNDARAYCNLGAAYNKKRMFDEAISECKKAIALDPNYAKAYFNLGSAYGNKGMMDEAIAHFKQAIIIEPGYANAHYNLALVYYAQGNYKVSLEYFDKAKELGTRVDPKIDELLQAYR